MSNEEIKKYLLEMLKDIKHVCIELGLTYFLDGGTLLGAVRHNGFIPWDDDIDIAMPRPDYEIFIKQFNKHCSEKYKLISIKNSMSYIYPWAKVYDKTTKIIEHGISYCNLGLSIDILPIDCYPDLSTERMNHWEKIVKVFSKYTAEEGYYFSHLSFSLKDLKKNIHVLLAKTGLFRKRAKKVVQNSKKSQNFYDSNYVGINVKCYYREKPRFLPKECFVPIQHIFEDDMYNIPNGYDLILKSYYGDDYMIPPPIDKRNSTHELEVFIK